MRVLAGPKAIVIGIVCDDPAPSGIVSFSVRRDAALTSEDHVRIVLGPFLDGRSGYVFAVNPSGARYDGLINPGGESDNPDWDGIWEAATRADGDGWSAEIRIPSRRLSFKPDLHEWHFNVQRRIQRLLETDRWAFPARQYQVTQTSRAGLLTDLPEFDLGRRPDGAAGGDDRRRHSRAVGATSRAIPAQPRRHAAARRERARLGDRQHRLRRDGSRHAPDEPDALPAVLPREAHVLPRRRRHLRVRPRPRTRTCCRTSAGASASSRGSEVPIIAGGKVNGRVGNTNFGGLVVGTNDKRGVVDDEAVMAVGRVKQNLWRESWVGAIATVGDPLGRSGSWLAGADFTYATSRFRGDKNFLVGVWGLATGRDGLGGDATAYGFKVDYPNDLWDIAAHLQADRPRLRSVARLRAAPRRASVSTARSTTARDIAQRPVPAAVSRVQAVPRDRSRRATGRAIACSSRR